MSTSPLSVRNITATPLELKLVERYRAPAILEPNFVSNFTRNLTSFVTTPAGPSATQLAENARSFDHHDISIHIAPFTQQNTDIKTSERSQNEVLRLTFECDGQRYRVDTPTSSKESQVLIPLSPDPKRQFTAVYLPSKSFLAIYSSANLQSWMRELKDATPLSALSIPGTHNSPTCYKALPSVRCQAVSVKEQLANGVRFLDIRLQPEDPANPQNATLILVHGVFPISLTGPKHFRRLVTDVQDFLAANPSETVIMSLKREGTGPSTDAQLSLILHDHYCAPDPTHWWTEPRAPYLGEARGKMVLLRRFALDARLTALHDGRGWALDAEAWAYNTAHDEHGAVSVQDFCEVLETVGIEAKVRYCCEHFERAGCARNPIPGVTTDAANPVPPGPLFLNFLSASNFWNVGCWPERIARRLNPAAVEFLCTRHDAEGKGNGDGGVGIVVCDWVGSAGDWDLVRCVVGFNARLQLLEGR